MALAGVATVDRWQHESEHLPMAAGPTAISPITLLPKNAKRGLRRTENPKRGLQMATFPDLPEFCLPQLERKLNEKQFQSEVFHNWSKVKAICQIYSARHE